MVPFSNRRQFSRVLLPVFIGLVFLFLKIRSSWDNESFSTIYEATDLAPLEHFGDASHLRKYKIWGEGLSKAVQGQESTVIIDFLAADGSNSSYTPPLDQNENIVVTLSGPALFSAETTYARGGRYIAKFNPIDAGKYRLRIEIFRRSAGETDPYTFWLPLGKSEGYSVTVTKPDGKRVPGDGRSSVKVSRGRCRTLAGNDDGRWLRCEDIGAPCARTGWQWVPRDCHYNIYSPAEIANRPLWILFVGTTVKHAPYFAAVDYLLGERASNIASSIVWKCKGWMDLRAGAFRTSYLHFRRECYGDGQGENCPPGYERATRAMLTKLGADGLGPDLVVWEAAGTDDVRDFTFVHELRAALGSDWTGTNVVGFRPQSPADLWTAAGLDIYPGLPNALRMYLRGSEVRFEGLAGMALPMFRTLSRAPKEATTDLWHRQCEENGMHSCSVMGDMEFQLLYDYASRMPSRYAYPLTYRQRLLGNTAANLTDTEQLEFCLQCPQSLEVLVDAEEPPECFDRLPY